MYLPIAEMATNPFVIIFFGALVGAMSGLFGVGGGFLMAPILFFLGIPPSIAVSTEATQICAASVSGSLAHFRTRQSGYQNGRLAGRGRFDWLNHWRLYLQMADYTWLGRFGNPAVLRGLPRWCWGADVPRKSTGHAAAQGRQNGQPQASSRLHARLAVPHKVPALQALHLRPFCR
jgi:hypothetical protein